MIDTSHASPALFAALAAAQAEVENATKSSANPHFKSRYADLAEVLNTVRPVFAGHGLSILQSTAYDGAMVSVTTLLAHKEGGFVSSTATCVPAKSDAQGIGAATTYLRRYSLAAMCGVAQEDDDGNTAAHAGKPATAEQRQQAADFRGAIGDAMTVSELEAVGAKLAAAGLPADLAQSLREIYGIRLRTLKAAAKEAA